MSSDNADGPLILCWDGSEAAGRAISYAARLFGASRRAIVVLAYVPTEKSGVLPGFSKSDAPIMGPGDAQAMLERGVAVAREASMDAEPELVVAESRTAAIIVGIAEERGAPLIVMGQRKRTGLGLLLGSVAREVLALQHRPVMLVGPEGPSS
jgi:nucleotide-binding universal stress UspA family protein